MLALQQAQQLGLGAAMRVVDRKHISRGSGLLRLFDRALALQIEILEEQLRVVGEVVQRGQQPALLVVIVVALRPQHLGQRRIGPVPGALVFIGIEDALLGVGAAVAERLVQTADAVVHRGDKHQIAGTPGVEAAMGEHAGHAEPGQLLHVVPA